MAAVGTGMCHKREVGSGVPESASSGVPEFRSPLRGLRSGGGHLLRREDLPLGPSHVCGGQFSEKHLEDADEDYSRDMGNSIIRAIERVVTGSGVLLVTRVPESASDESCEETSRAQHVHITCLARGGG